MRTRLLLLADNVDLDGSARGLCLRLGLCLLHDALGDDLLLHHLPEGGGDVVQEDRRRHAPAKEEHHDGHNGTHGHGLAPLRLGLGPHVEYHRDERQHAEQNVKEDVRRRGDPTARLDDLGHREREAGQDAEEARVGGNLLGNGEQAKEDGHLEEDGQTSAKRVELHLRVDLAHLLGLALRIVGIALLNLLELGLHDLHASRRLRRVRHERRENEADDDGQDDDREAPVANKALDAREHRSQKANKPIPHGSSAPSLGDGIVTSSVKGVTPADPAQRQPSALGQAIAGYGLSGILGAGRDIYAASTKER